MKRTLCPLVFAAVILLLGVTLAVAQTAPPPGAPGTGGTSPGMTPRPPVEKPVEKTVDGPVKKVDPGSNTVQVGWMLGMLSTTLAVTEDTHIAVAGAKGSLTDIREGDRVKAAYEAKDGKNIAKSIEVTKGEPKGGASGAGARPGGSSAPSSSVPKSP